MYGITKYWKFLMIWKYCFSRSIFQSILPFKESQDIWLTSIFCQPIRMFRLQFAWTKLQPSLLLSPMAKRSTFPRHCLTENMAWGTYIKDDAAQKIQAWISYRTDFQNRVQNSVRVIEAQWFPLKDRNWLEVYNLFRLIDEGNICRQKLKNNLRGELINSKVRIV